MHFKLGSWEQFYGSGVFLFWVHSGARRWWSSSLNTSSEKNATPWPHLDSMIAMAAVHGHGLYKPVFEQKNLSILLCFLTPQIYPSFSHGSMLHPT